MSSEIVFSVESLGKAYQIYNKPQDRLKQMLSFGKKQYYSEYWALNEVSFSITRGESVAIVGRNGSGKSTLLQILAGILQPTKGTVERHGRIAALLELGAGFNPEFTGEENITLSASLHGLSDEEIAERFDSIVEFAGLGDFISQPVKLYSSGMFARLAFSVAAHVDPDVLIIDEILAVGDAAFTQKCASFLHGFRKHGTLVFVSHDLTSVVSYCERAVWLENGFLRGDSSAKEIAHNYMAAIEEDKGRNNKSFKIGGSRSRPPVRVDEPVHTEKILAQNDIKNPVKCFEFDPDAPWFGYKGGSIDKAYFCDTHGEKLSTLEGGQLTTLNVDCSAQEKLVSPIVGFFIKNAQGLFLFGDNSYLTYMNKPLTVDQGESFTASFSFKFPYLPEGTYSVIVALSEGTQEDHVNHHWYDDAFFFTVNSSHIQMGLVGIPMSDISLVKSESLTSTQVAVNGE